MLADIMTKGLARDRFQNLRNLLIIYVCWNIDRYFLCNPRGGGYSGFQVTGMIEGFFLSLKFSIPGFFWVRKFGLGIKKKIGSALAL